MLSATPKEREDFSTDVKVADDQSSDMVNKEAVAAFLDQSMAGLSDNNQSLKQKPEPISIQEMMKKPEESTTNEDKVQALLQGVQITNIINHQKIA